MFEIMYAHTVAASILCLSFAIPAIYEHSIDFITV